MSLRHFQFVTVLAAGLWAVSATSLAAQARPTASQAQALLQARPELLNQLRQGISSSGMNAEQIRARLVAEGYPANLLDQYLGQSTSAAAPSADVFEAVRALGLMSETDLEELMQLNTGTAPRTAAARAADAIAADSGTVIFGLSLFRERSSLFMPNLDGPVDASYRLGPGDQLVLIITGDVELAHTLDVTREGFIVIPQVGQIGVANLTLGELEDLLYVRLGRAYSGIRRGAGATTRFSVSVSRLRSNQVFVAGDVVAPGSYRVTSAGTALTALYAAGGPTMQGSLRAVEVRRGGTLVSTLDVYDYLLRGDGAKDVRLRQGDVVFVPVHGRRARIYGAVTRPAIYEVKAGESLADLVRAAGGLTATATRRRVVIERILPAADREMGRERAVIEVPLAADGTVPALAMEDGDVVHVPGIADRVRGRVVVNGHVWSVGSQGYTPGLTLEDALKRAGGVKPDAYLGTVHVSRLRADSTRVQLRATLRDTTGATVAPLALQEDDEITVYSRTAFRPDRYVVISGAVKKGGRFPYRSGMTLRDLALMAGGVEEHAYLTEAEVARIPLQGDAKVTARSIRVPLDSSYLFDIAGASLSGANTSASEFPLEPFDNVLILRDPNWREPRSVQLFGEVRFPGRFTLLSRSERLSDVIKRAGGLTGEADPDGAYFARLVAAEEIKRLQESQARRVMMVSDTVDSAAAAKRAFDGVGDRIRVGVDLQEALRERGRSDDLLLEHGDSIHVPKLLQTVSVRGGVNAATALAHAGKRLGYYIDAAGGTTERARSRRAYVIQPNGKIESRRTVLGFIKLDPKPRPGATVVVPERGDVLPATNTLANISIVTQLVASLAAIVALSR
ncbi:MAG: SLBB domain-containing protein [Gemmatimonadaceae bacterium]|nr:SLBB domain-containing protein [Gemmatimonadaceae bacterium]